MFMLIKPSERLPMARLLYFLEKGEHLAHNCSKRQAAIAPDKKSGRFLRGQARQEAFHAELFHRAATWLASGHQPVRSTLPSLDRYQTALEEAISRHDFIETILAEQVILESLGEAILRHIEQGMVKCQAPFARLRRMLLRQEEAHHGFGERVLEQQVSLGVTSFELLRHKARPYLSLSHALIIDLAPLFEDIDEDPSTFLNLHYQILPDWLIQESPSKPHNTGANSPLPPRQFLSASSIPYQGKGQITS